MAKIRVVNHTDEDGKKWHHTQYMYKCLGCGYEHAFGLKPQGGHHRFNMNLNNPTVSPSLLQDFNKNRICHSFIKGGKIIYLNDCWHKLKGKTIELPEYD